MLECLSAMSDDKRRGEGGRKGLGLYSFPWGVKRHGGRIGFVERGCLRGRCTLHGGLLQTLKGRYETRHTRKARYRSFASKSSKSYSE